MIHIDFGSKVNLFDLQKPWGRLMYQPPLKAWQYQYSQIKHEHDRSEALNKGIENVNFKVFSAHHNKIRGNADELEM